MEKFQECIVAANRAFKTADHLTYMTFPLVKDMKLLITIIENIYLCSSHCMDAFLEYDKLYKRIGLYSSNYEARFDILKNKSSFRYDIPKEMFDLMAELKVLVSSHKKSPMEFIRKDQLVICSSDYKMKTVGVEKIKEYLVKLKSMLNLVNNLRKET